jgi:hypothetical protein
MHWIDASSLPETRGRVLHFLLNPHGELDGLILSRNRVVHFPPHMSQAVARNLKLGDQIKVRALRPRGAPIFAAVSITGPNGKEIIDEGPREHKKNVPRQGKELTIAGTVTHSIHGPKGELRGAFLDTGVSLRVPAHAAGELVNYLAVGARVEATGTNIKNKFGSVVDVAEISLLK